MFGILRIFWWIQFQGKAFREACPQYWFYLCKHNVSVFFQSIFIKRKVLQ